jgi:hypothetical protein
MSFSEGYSIILDPDTLPDINVIEDYYNNPQVSLIKKRYI